jgi:hypothetical protein
VTITIVPGLGLSKSDGNAPVGSCANMKKLKERESEQLVLDQMDVDLSGMQGVRTIQHKIAMTTGQHITRDFVSSIMHAHDPAGFERRDPSSKRIVRTKKVPLGIHERWSANGHDKLYWIGFPILAIVDDATGKWLGIWVVLSNLMGHIVAYLFLCAVERHGGKPSIINSLLASHQFKLIGLLIQMTTDCGSETTQLSGPVNALWYVTDSRSSSCTFARIYQVVTQANSFPIHW